jgi:hypothetical protein
MVKRRFIESDLEKELNYLGLRGIGREFKDLLRAPMNRFGLTRINSKKRKLPSYLRFFGRASLFPTAVLR